MLVSGKRPRLLPREHRRFDMGGTKHLECVIREAHCRADSATFQQSLEQALDGEISRMRTLGVTAERIAAFREAAEVHIALCNASALPESADKAERPLDAATTKNC
jgi:hypothetical protein